MKMYCIYIVHSPQILYNTKQSDGIEDGKVVYKKKQPKNLVWKCFLLFPHFSIFWFSKWKLSARSIPKTEAASSSRTGTKADTDRASKKSWVETSSRSCVRLENVWQREQQLLYACVRVCWCVDGDGKAFIIIHLIITQNQTKLFHVQQAHIWLGVAILHNTVIFNNNVSYIWLFQTLTLFWNNACFHGNIIKKKQGCYIRGALKLLRIKDLSEMWWGNCPCACVVISGQWIPAWGRAWRIAPPAGGALRCATPSLSPPAGRTWSWPGFLLGVRSCRF